MQIPIHYLYVAAEREQMFRFLVALLLLASPAAAKTLTHEYTGNGSSTACAKDMTQAEHSLLWNTVLHELEFAGYKASDIPNPDAKEFSNGFYFLILSQDTGGFCVTYRDAYQPQIPAMYYGEK